MSQKRAAVVDIVRYFETADLPLADQALALVRAIMARRHSNPNPTAVAAAAAKRSHHKKPDQLPGLVSEVGE